MITRTFTAVLVDPTGLTPLRVRLEWEPSSHVEVTVAFQTGSRRGREHWVDWVLARDLLSEGLSGPAGSGDVRLHPDLGTAGTVDLMVSSPAGSAWVRLPRRPVRAFLTATCKEIPLDAALSVQEPPRWWVHSR